MQVSYDNYQMPACPQEHIFDGVWKDLQQPVWNHHISNFSKFSSSKESKWYIKIKEIIKLIQLNYDYKSNTIENEIKPENN